MGGLGGQAAPKAEVPELGKVCHIVSMQHLQSVLKDYPGVVLDMWSPTCPPCMRIKPVYE